MVDIEINEEVYKRLCTVIDRNCNRPAKGIEIDAFMSVSRKLSDTVTAEDWNKMAHLYLAAVTLAKFLPESRTSYTSHRYAVPDPQYGPANRPAPAPVPVEADGGILGDPDRLGGDDASEHDGEEEAESLGAHSAEPAGLPLQRTGRGASVTYFDAGDGISDAPNPGPSADEWCNTSSSGSGDQGSVASSASTSEDPSLIEQLIRAHNAGTLRIVLPPGGSAAPPELHLSAGIGSHEVEEEITPPPGLELGATRGAFELDGATDGIDTVFGSVDYCEECEALYGYATISGVDELEPPPGLTLSEPKKPPALGVAATEEGLKAVDAFKADQPEAGRVAEQGAKKIAARSTVRIKRDELGHIAAGTRDNEKYAIIKRHFKKTEMRYGSIGEVDGRMKNRVSAVVKRLMSQMDMMAEGAKRDLKGVERTSWADCPKPGHRLIRGFELDACEAEMDNEISRALWSDEAPYDHDMHCRGGGAIFVNWRAYMPKTWSSATKETAIYQLSKRQKRSFFVKTNEILKNVKPRLIQKFGMVGGFVKCEAKWLEDLLFGCSFFENRSVKHAGPEALRTRFRQFLDRFPDSKSLFGSMDYGSFDGSQGITFRSLVENELLENLVQRMGTWAEDISAESMKQRATEILRTESSFWGIESDFFGRESGDSGTSVLNFVSAIVAFLVQMCCETGLHDILQPKGKPRKMKGRNATDLLKESSELYLDGEPSVAQLECAKDLLCTPFDIRAVDAWFAGKSAFDIAEEGDDGLWAFSAKWVKDLGGSLRFTNRLVARAEMLGFQLEPQNAGGRIEPGKDGLSTRKEHCSHIIARTRGGGVLRIPKFRKCHTSLAVSWSAGKLSDPAAIHRECATKALATCANNIDSPIVFELASLIYKRHTHAAACGSESALSEPIDVVNREHYSLDTYDRQEGKRCSFEQIHEGVFSKVSRFYQHPTLMEDYSETVRIETLGKISESNIARVIDRIRGCDYTDEYKVSEVYEEVGDLLGTV